MLYFFLHSHAPYISAFLSVAQRELLMREESERERERERERQRQRQRQRERESSELLLFYCVKVR